jgi:hypothetical protein
MTPGAATVENTTMDTPVVRNITIPPKALEAAEKVIEEHRYSKRSDAAIAYAVGLAMLAHWPGAEHHVGKDEWNLDGDTWTVRFVDAIILPLPKEPSNDT